MLEDFGMLQCNPIIVPMLNIFKLSTYMKSKEVDATIYKTIVGKFIFLTNIKHNITFAIGIVGRYMLHHKTSF
ncbi:hypothetical protein CY35_02G021000 [Sphagnum magellanicum]|jgi:hypothetical protein|nr:hypothetical protein CY35_02G021000 [Sphagnum magellanicum]